MGEPSMRKTANIILALVVASYVVLQAAGPAIPAPESVFGFKPGADNKLATYDQAIAYLKKLEAASRSIRLVEAGKTTQGRTMYFALISSPANLAKIDRLREIAQRLAHPQNLTDAEARALAREGTRLRPHRRRLPRHRGGRAADGAAAGLQPAHPDATTRSSRRSSPTTSSCCGRR